MAFLVIGPFIRDWCEIAKIILKDRPLAREKISEAYIITLTETLEEKIPTAVQQYIVDAINIVNIFMDNFNLPNFLDKAIEYSKTITKADYSKYNGEYINGKDSNKWIKKQIKSVTKTFPLFGEFLSYALDILDPLWTAFEYLSYLVWSNNETTINEITNGINKYLNKEIEDF